MLLRKLYMILFLYQLILNHSVAQTKLAEIQLPTSKVRNIQSFALRDSIIMSFDVLNPAQNLWVKTFLFIEESGKYEELKTTLIGESQLFGAKRYNNLFYLYYVSGKKKHATIKVLTYDGTRQATLEDEIPLNGTLVGTWCESDLGFITYDWTSNQLRVRQIDRMDVVFEQVFTLPTKLDLFEEISFLPEGKVISFADASSRLKLFKRGDELILTFDQTKSEGASQSSTLIIRMNLKTGNLSTKRYKDADLFFFRSFVTDRTLFQMSVSKKSFELDIKNLETGDLLDHKTIVRDTTLEKVFVYKRVGADNRISSSKETLYNTIKISPACIPFVIPIKDSISASFIWGTYFNEKGGVGSPGSMANPAAGLITFALTTAVKQIGQPPGISRYMYMTSGKDQSMNYWTRPFTLQRIIDDYEINLDQQRSFFDYKGYLNYKDGAIGIYRGHRDTNSLLTVILYKLENSH